jgi:hypothetical protein
MQQPWLKVALGAFAVWLGVGGCVEATPFVVLTIADPEGHAAAAVTLAVDPEPTAEVAIPLRPQALPLQLTITAPQTGTRTLWAEAYDSTSIVIARGKTEALFATQGTPTAQIQLHMPCEQDANCDTGLFCGAQWQCEIGRAHV